MKCEYCDLVAMHEVIDDDEPLGPCHQHYIEFTQNENEKSES